MRKLASIQRIIRLDPIPDADKIVKATVLGWEVVVLKYEFKEGDLCCYCEVDSILPDRPEFEFLRERKFRIKTIRLKKQISQGICFPLSVLPKGKYLEGDDVTSTLGVTKYDPEAEWERKEALKRQQIEKNRFRKFFARYAWYRRLFFRPERLPFPAFIKKTDEDRIQTMPWVLENKDLLFHFTEKLDGTSATYFLIRKRGLLGRRYIFGVCSRNFQLLRKDNVYWRVAKQYGIEKCMKTFFEADQDLDNVVLQGEIVGEGVQGNKYNIKGLNVYFFNLFLYGTPRDVSLLAPTGLNVVPLLFGSRLPETMQECVKLATIRSALVDGWAEGVVARSLQNNISFKIINPEFLLQHNL